MMPENCWYGNENAFTTSLPPTHPPSLTLAPHNNRPSKQPRPVIKPIHILLMLFSFS